MIYHVQIRARVPVVDAIVHADEGTWRLSLLPPTDVAISHPREGVSRLAFRLPTAIQRARVFTRDLTGWFCDAGWIHPQAWFNQPAR
jgi:hypothetical protein